MKAPLIEKNIPIPPRRKINSFTWPEFLMNLQFGDSFVTTKLESVRQSAYNHNINITIRVLAEGVYRIWKIK